MKGPEQNNSKGKLLLGPLHIFLKEGLVIMVIYRRNNTTTRTVSASQSIPNCG